MKVLAVALLVPSLTLAACAAASPAEPAPMVVTVQAAATAKQVAGLQAKSLLALVQLPPAAQPLNAPPPSLGRPALGVPAVESLVDQPLFWRVPGMAPADTVAWIKAHPPRGLSPSGSSALQTGAYTVSGLGFQAADSDAQLQIGVAADGTSSVVRADALVVWYDSSPRPDSAPGPRLRVTVDGGCPAEDRQVVGVTNPAEPSLDGRLLPAGVPTAALICAYTGMNGKPTFHLHDHRRLEAVAAAQVAAMVAALPLRHAVGTVTSCPLDDGGATVIAFSYAGRPDADLWVTRTGCAVVNNGHISAGAGDLRDV